MKSFTGLTYEKIINKLLKSNVKLKFYIIDQEQHISLHQDPYKLKKVEKVP